MKLAEALLLRSQYKAKLQNLQQRLLANVKVQGDDKPLEEPQALITEIFDLNDQLCELIKQINDCNAKTKLESGLTLADAIVHRDMVVKKRKILALAVDKATEKEWQLSRSEIKLNVVIPVAEIQKKMDDLSKEYRELDTKIQALNWSTDL